MAQASVARPPLRGRKKAQTRLNIVQRARELFDRKGFDATTIDEIADAADVHKQTVFRYFGSKEEIALVFRIDAFEEFKGSLLDPDRTVSVIQCWREHVKKAAARVAKRGDFYRYTQLIHSDPRLYAASLRLEIAHEELIARALSEEADVDPATDIHARLLATLLVGGSRAVGRMMLDNNSLDQMEQASLAVVDFAIENFPERRGRAGAL
ncbi:MAG: hypothetical protein DI570_18165 [Phenylobacterium zucineum]|nr:MAG: hypothetical protein DI570_18165 [Phenylobacterium zucineum]